MRSLDFPTLLDAHVRMQAGCYVSGVDHDGGEARFLWSETIAEPAFNLAVGTDDPGRVRAMAAERGRLPALLVEDEAAAGRIAGLGAFPTRWMARATAAAPPLPGTLRLDTGTGAAPGEAFLAVCGRLFADEAANAVAKAAFLPTLRAARSVAGVETRHLTLSDGDVPVACASVYAAGDLAGLYNVGTVAHRQGRGLGAAVTLAAIGAARDAGACAIVLHCAAGSPAERLYAGLGFTVAAAPAIVVLSPE